MKQWIGELVRPHEGASTPDVVKRVAGAALQIAVFMPAQNKQFYTVPIALLLSDTSGAYGRHILGRLAQTSSSLEPQNNCAPDPITADASL